MKGLPNHIATASLCIVMLLSCDTKDSFSPPEQSYFLKYFGDDGNHDGVDFVVNSDGSFVLLGNSKKASGSRQIYVAKADSNGKLLWERTFGGILDEEARDIELLADGNLIILANSEVSPAPNRNRDVLLLRINQDGVKLDSVRQGLFSLLPNIPEPNDEDAKSITVINNGFVVAGGTTKPGDNSDFMYMRFRSNLSFVKDTDPETWNSKPITGFAGEDVAVKLIQFNLTTFYLFGYTNADPTNTASISNFNFFAVTLSNLGVVSSGQLFIVSNANEKLTSVSLSPAQSGLGYLLSGTSQNATDGDVFLVKLGNQLAFNQTDILFTTIINLKAGKPNSQSTSNSSSLSRGYFVTTEQLNGNSTEIVLTKRDNGGNEIFTRTFSGIGNDFSGSVIELPTGQIIMIGTMTLGGVVDGQKKIVLMKLNPQGLLAP
jgi:hypothetical protein